MELDEAIGRFLRGMKAADRSSRTVRWYEDILRRFERRGGALTVDALEEYLAERKSEVAHSSFAGEHRAFRRFCSWLVARKHMPNNPMLEIERPRRADPPAPNVATDEIVLRLLEAANGSKFARRDRAIVMVLADTGARLSEFLAITMTNLQVIHERGVEYGRAVIVGKGRKRRVLMIGPAAMSELAAWITERPPEAGDCIWWSEQGQPLTATGIQQILRRLSKRAGLKRVMNPHSFRHGFALAGIANGEDIRTVQYMLGHSQITTTARYLSLSDKMVSDAHDRVSESRFAHVPPLR